MTPLIAVDHFAGTGWGVACHELGIVEYGVEMMRDAIRTRSANGMRTIYRDVWSGLFHGWLVPPHKLYIASPPCQTFSLAGGGDGRKALDDVLTAIDEGRHKNPASLHALGEELDPRTALVMTPLAHIWAHRPGLVALEQVPPVLPIWRAIAAVLRTLGYSVWTGMIRSEQYGVPQTRKRAILLARLDGIAAPPTPTHSRYYSGAPKRLDPGVLPWVSMAQALGWGMTAQNSAVGGGETERYGERPARQMDEPAFTLRANGGGNAPGGFVWFDRPATTLGADDRVAGPGRSEFVKGGTSRQDRPGTVRVTVAEAAALQSYPRDFIWRGSKTRQFLQIGNAVPPLMAHAILAALTAPAEQRSPWDQVFAEVAG